MELGFVLLICFFLLFISALVSASETANFSLSPQNLEELEHSDEKGSKKVMELQKDPRLLLATILVANNFVNVSIVVLFAYFINSWIDFSAVPIWGFFIQTIVITFLLLFFGEILPKVYASRNALSFSKKMSGFLLFLQRILRPFSKLLIHSTSVVNKRISKHSYENLSMEQLSQALELTTTVEDEDKEILQGIVRFGNVHADSCMTSRIDMEVLDIKTPFSEVMKKIIETGYSRIPIYSGSYDSIKGILYTKDLIPHIDKPNSFKWQALIRPAFFVPETKKINDLLEDFQQNKIHMAIVVDEFGGTSGLITMEDILEEIVGEINDEYDDDDLLHSKIDDRTYIFEAKIFLNDFYRVTGISQEQFDKISSEVDTLAGLILELKGEIPTVHERVEYKNYIFEILSSDNRRIKKVKLYIKA